MYIVQPLAGSIVGLLYIWGHSKIGKNKDKEVQDTSISINVDRGTKYHEQPPPWVYLWPLIYGGALKMDNRDKVGQR